MVFNSIRKPEKYFKKKAVTPGHAAFGPLLNQFPVSLKQECVCVWGGAVYSKALGGNTAKEPGEEWKWDGVASLF